MFRTSQKLNEILATLLADETAKERLGEEGPITTGHDNDGSTGRDMAEIGIGIGLSLAKKGPEYSAWLANHPTEHLGWPLIAKDEEDAIRTLRQIAQ